MPPWRRNPVEGSEMDGLLSLDRELFQLVNGQWTASALDWLLPTITNLHKEPIAMALVLPLALAFWIWRSRMRAAKSIVALAIAVAASDLISYRLIKPMFDRPRPEQAGVSVQLRVASQVGPSFPSNHAANTFAEATILWFAIGRWAWIAFIYAAAIAYSRVYVGVHYPSDVIGGAMLGALCAYAVWAPLKRWVASPSWGSLGFRKPTDEGVISETPPKSPRS